MAWLLVGGGFDYDGGVVLFFGEVIQLLRAQYFYLFFPAGPVSLELTIDSTYPFV